MRDSHALLLKVRSSWSGGGGIGSGNGCRTPPRSPGGCGPGRLPFTIFTMMHITEAQRSSFLRSHVASSSFTIVAFVAMRVIKLEGCPTLEPKWLRP